jgi:hypothetical protein
VTRRAWSVRLGLLGGTCALILVVLEIGARLFSNLSAPMYVNDAVLGKIYRANASTLAYVPECECRVFLRFNADGLRGPQRSRTKPAGVRRVALVGDSMTVAVATAEERTTASVLEELLNASAVERRFEVINGGVSGSSTGQEWVLYREVVRHYEPDIVVLAFFTGNDLADSSPRLTSSGHRVYFDLDAAGQLVQRPLSVPRQDLASWLNEHSRFYVWHKRAYKGLRSRFRSASATMESGDIIYWTRPTGDAAHAWTLLERLLAAMKADVDADGGHFALAALPAGAQILEHVWDSHARTFGGLAGQMDPGYPESRLAEICARLDIPLVRMLDGFRAAAAQGEVLHYGGDGHFNDAGNRLAARILHRYLTGVAPSSTETSTPRSRAVRSAH